MNYKTELHCHSGNISKCATISDSEIVDNYIKKGYSTIVLTNHYSCHTFEDMPDASWKEKNDYFIDGYKSLVKEADGRINIILGMEYRNNYTENDYLVYGITEDFIQKYSCNNSNNFLDMHLKQFVGLAHENGILVFQAHPFRNGMTVINPSFIDGVEILNGHEGHDSRNDIASMWAKKYNLLTSGGSDCHYAGAEGKVALITENEITNADELVSVLKTNVENNLERVE